MIPTGFLKILKNFLTKILRNFTTGREMSVDMINWTLRMYNPYAV